MMAFMFMALLDAGNTAAIGKPAENRKPAISTQQTSMPTPIKVPLQATAPVVKSVAASKIDKSVLQQILAKAANDLGEQLVGIWDSDNQSFFEPEFNIPSELRHPRLFVKVSAIAPLATSDKDAKAFLVDYREGGENGKRLKTRIFNLVPDIASNSVRRDVYDAKSSFKHNNITNIQLSDFVKLDGCAVYFRKRISGFAGDTIPNSCVLKSLDGQNITASEHHDIDDKFWEVTDFGVTEAGKIAYGTLDNSPTRLRKANQYKCWVSYSDNGKIRTINDLVTYDAGGEAMADFGKDSVKIRLRNVDWPSGNNRPSLTLYLLQNNQNYSNIYSWTDEGANRIALSYNFYQASCTKL